MIPEAPYFSLITPVYNRSQTIKRAIESCLSQSFTDFELLIVDDASNDDSLAVISSFKDERIKVFRHEHNQGPCPARNTAVAAAKGKWCIIFDSDFELLPGALEDLFLRTQNLPREIGDLASSCQWDTGMVTPRPSSPEKTLDFCGFLAWAGSVVIPEKLECIRREVFKDIKFPAGRAWEFEFHLDLASRWQVRISPVIAVKIHTDAPNRLTAAGSAGAIQRMLRDAPDKLASLERAVVRHQEQIKRCSPGLYRYTLALIANLAFLNAQRKKGAGYLLKALSLRFYSLNLWVYLFLGLALSPRMIARITLMRRKLLESRG